MKEKNRTTLQAAIRRRVHAKAYPFCGAQTGLLVVINEQRNISALQISAWASVPKGWQIVQLQKALARTPRLTHHRISPVKTETMEGKLIHHAPNQKNSAWPNCRICCRKPRCNWPKYAIDYTRWALGCPLGGIEQGLHRRFSLNKNADEKRSGAKPVGINNDPP